MTDGQTVVLTLYFTPAMVREIMRRRRLTSDDGRCVFCGASGSVLSCVGGMKRKQCHVCGERYWSKK